MLTPNNRLSITRVTERTAPINRGPLPAHLSSGSLPQDHQQECSVALGAEGHPHADVVRALCDEVRHDALDADDGQNQGKHREGTEDQHVLLFTGQARWTADVVALGRAHVSRDRDTGLALLPPEPLRRPVSVGRGRGSAKNLTGIRYRNQGRK